MHVPPPGATRCVALSRSLYLLHHHQPRLTATAAGADAFYTRLEALPLTLAPVSSSSLLQQPPARPRSLLLRPAPRPTPRLPLALAFAPVCVPFLSTVAITTSTTCNSSRLRSIQLRLNTHCPSAPRPDHARRGSTTHALPVLCQDSWNQPDTAAPLLYASSITGITLTVHKLTIHNCLSFSLAGWLAR